MSHIHIVQPHAMSQEQARQAARQVSEKLSREYQLACVWEGDTMRFTRSGVTGKLVLGAGQAAVDVRLGLLMGAFAPMIREKLTANLKKVFTV